jgi:6-phosphogluconolactonase
VSQPDEVHVVTLKTAGDAAAAAAERIAGLLRAAVAGRGRATMALSGGTTPRDMIRLLARLDVPWASVDVFQVDERVVDLADPDRNWLIFSPLAAIATDSRLHPMPVEHADGDERYRGVLRQAAGVPVTLDVVHLGLGTDGHTASLVPGDPAVDVTDREVSWSTPYRGHRRMTLTVPVLRQARHQIWLVIGSDKADRLGRLVKGRDDGPAARVLVAAGATVFTDAAAASVLSNG